MSSVLILRSAALGDFIMSTPALAAVRNAFPGYRLVLLTIQASGKSQRSKVAHYAGGTHRVPWVELAKPHLIDEVIVLSSTTDILYVWQLRRTLLQHRFDTAILMTDVWSPWLGRCLKWLLLRFLIGAVPVLGWRGSGNPRRLREKGQLKHHVHGPLKFLGEMTPPKQYRDEDLVFDLRPDQGAVDWACTWIKTRRLDGGKRLLAVAPGSIQPHKRWPIGSFKLLITAILARFEDIHVVVIGTQADRVLGESLATVEPGRIDNLAGVTSIAQSAALLRMCHLLVGNDGGAMHLGDAMGCRVVSIVPGIEYPDSIEPWHNKALAIRHPVECSPCYNFVSCPRGHNRCMTDLPVEKVLERCVSALG
jgi:heptosyltransferase-2